MSQPIHMIAREMDTEGETIYIAGARDLDIFWRLMDQATCGMNEITPTVDEVLAWMRRIRRVRGPE